MKQKLKPYFRAAVKDSVLELAVYEEIGENFWTGEGVTAARVKQQLDKSGPFSSILLRINSPGGDAFEGVAIKNLLIAQKKPIVAVIDGLAASAASILAMCADKVEMGRSSMMMIHKALTGQIGNADDMRKAADTLDKIDAALSESYAKKTGKSQDEILQLMQAETWMTAEDCIQGGFADAMTDEEEDGDAMALAETFKNAWKGLRKPAQSEVAEPVKDVLEAVAVELANYRALAAKGGVQAVDYSSANGNLAIRVFANAAVKDAASNKISGVVAPYDSLSCDLGNFKEIYQRGCFEESLSDEADARVLFNHDPNYVLGRQSAGTARFWEEADGLHYEADAPDTQWARDLQVSLERGDIRESSAAFYILQHRWEQRGQQRVRVVEKARLVEGGPHSFAAYPGSTAEAQPEQAKAQAGTEDLERVGARLRLLRLQ